MEQYSSDSSQSLLWQVALRRVSILRGANRHVSPPEPEFSQLMLQRLAVHAENGRGARDVAAGFLETPRDVAALELSTVVAKI